MRSIDFCNFAPEGREGRADHRRQEGKGRKPYEGGALPPHAKISLSEPYYIAAGRGIVSLRGGKIEDVGCGRRRANRLGSLSPQHNSLSTLRKRKSSYLEELSAKREEQKPSRRARKSPGLPREAPIDNSAKSIIFLKKSLVKKRSQIMNGGKAPHSERERGF